MTDGKDVNGILLIRYSSTKFFDIHFIFFILQNQKNPGFFVGTSGILLRLGIRFLPFVSEIAFYRMTFRNTIRPPSMRHLFLEFPVARKTKYRHKMRLAAINIVGLLFTWNRRTQFSKVFASVTMASSCRTLHMTPQCVQPATMSNNALTNG